MGQITKYISVKFLCNITIQALHVIQYHRYVNVTTQVDKLMNNSYFFYFHTARGRWIC